MQPDRYLGIDLGTTNSAVSVLSEEEPTVLPNPNGKASSIMPSVVAYDPQPDSSNPGEKSWFVGDPAKAKARQAPETTIESVKRHMGDNIDLSLSGRKFQPQEISARILQKLKMGAEEHLERKFSNAVVTVPAYFNDAQRRATMDAASIAGFDRVDLLNEPTAAALAYNYVNEDFTERLKKREQTILVFDLGGGTLDVTIMEYSGAVHEVKATEGDTELGGDDWDEALLEYVAQDIKEETGMDPLNEDRFGAGPRVALLESIRRAKHQLAESAEVDVEAPFVFNEFDDPVDESYNYTGTLTRREFQEATEHLTKRIKPPVEKALEDATDISKETIDEVLLVGGATRMPQIRERLEDMLGTKPMLVHNPETIVARGASIRGGMLADELRGIAFRDVIPLSIGVKTRGDKFERIIGENSTVPAEESRTFTTSARGQTSVDIHVFQGEREVASENQELGHFTLSGIPPAPAGTPQIEVTFSVNNDGMLRVEAEEKATELRNEVMIDTRRTGLTADAIEDARDEAAEFAEADKEFRRKRNIQNTAESRLQEATELLNSQGDVIGPQLKQEIRSRSESVDRLLDEALDDEEEVDYESLQRESELLLETIEQVGVDLYQPEDIHQEPENPEHPGYATTIAEDNSGDDDPSDDDDIIVTEADSEN